MGKWKESEQKQLDQYYGQRIFGEPCSLPPGANVLNLLWFYNVKDDGRLNARMVCNGKLLDKNTVIFGHTYAKSLDHVGSCVFWAACASKNFIVQGADASNVFVEADTPKVPLFVRVNEQYRKWWNKKMKRPNIPSNFVLPVHKAFQVHPEAPQVWATLIDNILWRLKFKPTMHEPCLYQGMFDGKEVLFLRQVDDFAVGAQNESTSIAVINEIDKYMKIDIKDLGQLDRYNGVDIIQVATKFPRLNLYEYKFDYFFTKQKRERREEDMTFLTFCYHQSVLQMASIVALIVGLWHTLIMKRKLTAFSTISPHFLLYYPVSFSEVYAYLI
jgi:hypothetical protein